MKFFNWPEKKKSIKKVTSNQEEQLDSNRRVFLKTAGTGLLGAYYSILTGYGLGTIYKIKPIQDFLTSLDKKRLRNNEQYVQEMREYFVNRYGINLQIGFDRYEVVGTHNRDSYEDIPLENIIKHFTAIATALSVYPEGFVKELTKKNPIEIVLANNFKYMGFKSALAYVSEKPGKENTYFIPYDTAKTLDHDDDALSYLISATHHELNHYFLFVHPDKDRIIEEWEAIRREAEKSLPQELYKKTFFNSHGMSNVYEDIATHAQWFFIIGSDQYLDDEDSTSGYSDSNYSDDYPLEEEGFTRSKKGDKNTAAILGRIVVAKHDLVKKMYFKLSNGAIDDKFWNQIQELQKQEP